MAIVLLTLLLSVLGFYWYTLDDWRDLDARMKSLEVYRDMVDRHLVETAKALKTLRVMENDIQEARHEVDTELEKAGDLRGDARFDYLLRLLREDRARRGGADATDGVAGAVPGAGGQ